LRRCTRTAILLYVSLIYRNRAHSSPHTVPPPVHFYGLSSFHNGRLLQRRNDKMPQVAISAWNTCLAADRHPPVFACAFRDVILRYLIDAFVYIDGAVYGASYARWRPQQPFTPTRGVPTLALGGRERYGVGRLGSLSLHAVLCGPPIPPPLPWFGVVGGHMVAPPPQEDMGGTRRRQVGGQAWALRHGGRTSTSSGGVPELIIYRRCA